MLKQFKQYTVPAALLAQAPQFKFYGHAAQLTPL